MAKLPPPGNTGNPFADQIGDDLAPMGTFGASILDIKDAFGVERQKYESTEMETVDLTCFLFGFRDQQGVEHRVASKRMRISGNEKSALFGFLKGLLGKAPEVGYDYCDLKGSRCLITAEHVQRKNGSGTYAAIASLSPLPPGYGDTAPVPQQPVVTPPDNPGAVISPVAQTTQAVPPPPPSPAPADPGAAPQPPTQANPSAGEQIPF